jgi:hypothetical protein
MNKGFFPAKKINDHGISGFSENEFSGFAGKTFHLSKGFKNEDGSRLLKKNFAKSIEELGGKCRGYGKLKGLKLSEMDYLVLGELKPEEGKKDKQDQIEKINLNPNKENIPIMSQSKCEELIGKYQKTYGPK